MQFIRFKRLHPDAKTPEYQNSGAVCFKLHALYCCDVLPGCATAFQTGLSFEIPEGFVMMVFSRAGIGFKNRISLGLDNGSGIIDSNYRGEVKVLLSNDDDRPFRVTQGDCIAQAMIIPVPAIYLSEADELSTTERGANGIGSIGV